MASNHALLWKRNPANRCLFYGECGFPCEISEADQLLLFASSTKVVLNCPPMVLGLKWRRWSCPTRLGPHRGTCISMNTGLRIETFKPDNLVRDRDFNLKHQ